MFTIVSIITFSSCSINEFPSESSATTLISPMPSIEIPSPAPLLTLSAPQQTNWNMYFSCKEMGTKAQFHNESFVQDIGVEYTTGKTFNGEGFIFDGMRATITDDSLDGIINFIEVKSYSNDEDKYTWVFNEFLYIGANINEILYESGIKYSESPTIDGKYCVTIPIDENGKMDGATDRVAVAMVWCDTNGFVKYYWISTNYSTPSLICNDYLSIYSVNTSVPNSVGGVDANIVFANLSGKTIKYIYFTLTPYNAVYDIVKSEIANKSKVELEMTGPISQTNILDYDKLLHTTSENVWYNSNIKFALLNSVRIVYMDGEEVIIQGC